MNLNNIGHAHTIPAVTVLLLTLLHLFMYMYLKQITQYIHSRYFEIWFSSQS